MGISLITIKFLVTFFVNEETFGAGSLPATSTCINRTHAHTQKKRIATRPSVVFNRTVLFLCLRF